MESTALISMILGLAALAFLSLRSSPSLTPTRTTNIASLILGVAYLALVAVGVQALARIPLPAAIAITFAGATVIVISLAILCARFVSQTEKSRRIRLSTILLIFIPVSVYLSAIHWLVSAIRSTGEEVPLVAWIVFGGMQFMAAWITLVVLMRAAIAVIWLFSPAAKTIRRAILQRRRR